MSNEQLAISNEQLAMSNYPQTRQMKDSGVEWIGEIPVNWLVLKNSVIFKNVSIKDHGKDMVLSLYRDLGIVPKDSRDDNHNVTSLDTDSYKFVECGDLVINKMKAWSGSVAVSDYTGIVSPAYYVCKINYDYVNKRFIHHYLRNSRIVNVYEMLSAGMRIGQWDLGIDDFLRIEIALPPLSEQQTISDYLDRKCTQIDTLIANQQQQIEKLKAYKQSVITETVTKGLAPDVAMKDSGVEWIGRISTKHSIKKLKFLLFGSLMYGANESGEPYDESLPRYIRITDIAIDGSLKTTGRLSLSYDIATPYLLKDGDILFARSGATVGKAFIFKSEYGKSAFAGYLIKARVKDDVDPQYIYYYTQSSLYEEWKNQIFIQATIQNIGADKYSQLPVVIQSLEEQHEIVAYLDCKCSQIDRLIAIKQQKIEKLQQYKKSLIYEYVTGKKQLAISSEQ